MASDILNIEVATLVCRSSNAAAHTSQTSTNDDTVGPWNAIAQLHQPNRNAAVAIMAYQLPSLLPNGMLEAPKELKVKVENKEKAKSPPIREYEPPVPYLQRLKKKEHDYQFAKFLKRYKALHINMPFVECLA